VKIVLNRISTSDMGTFGAIHLNGKRFLTGELPWRLNAKQVSCIPEGEYEIAIVNSPKFGKVYGVKNVPNRSNVLIHSANLMGDSRYYDTQLHGCIGVGQKIGMMRNSRGQMQIAVLMSRQGLREFMQELGNKPATLVIQGRGAND
jgi:hypothetical protein